MNQITMAMNLESGAMGQEEAELIATVSEMQQALRRGLPIRSLDAMLARLSSYFNTMFRHEEERLSIEDPRQLEWHRMEHSQLIARLTGYRMDLNSGHPLDGVAVMQQLKSWIICHRSKMP